MFRHSFLPYLFPKRPNLFNDRFSVQSLRTACISGRMLAPSQTADGAQKSLRIILNLFQWPTVQNIHLHWVFLKSALTASKHWTPSTATTVSIFKQYPPPYPATHIFSFPHTQSLRHSWPIHSHLSNRLHLAAAIKPTFSSTARNSQHVHTQSSLMVSTLFCLDIRWSLFLMYSLLSFPSLIDD